MNQKKQKKHEESSDKTNLMHVQGKCFFWASKVAVGKGLSWVPRVYMVEGEN